MAVTLSGSVSGVTASVLLDYSCATSYLSTGFVLAHQLPRRLVFEGGVSSFTVSLPITLPSPCGWYTLSRSLQVAYHPTHDVVLGTDCLDALVPRLAGSVLLDPLDVGLLGRNCHWTRSPALGMFWSSLMLHIFLLTRFSFTQESICLMTPRLKPCPLQTIRAVYRPPIARGVTVRRREVQV